MSLRLVALLLCLALGSVTASASDLEPGVGFDDGRLGMSRAELESAWGNPEVNLNQGRIWYYPSRCATFGFSAKGIVKVVGVGNDAQPERLDESCARVSVAAALRLGVSIAEATSLFKNWEELGDKDERRRIFLVRTDVYVLQLHFWNGQLNYASTSLSTSRSDAK